MLFFETRLYDHAFPGLINRGVEIDSDVADGLQ